MTYLHPSAIYSPFSTNWYRLTSVLTLPLSVVAFGAWLYVISSVSMPLSGSIDIGDLSPGIVLVLQPGPMAFAAVVVLLSSSCILLGRCYSSSALGSHQVHGRLVSNWIILFALSCLTLLVVDNLIVFALAFELQTLPLVLLLSARVSVRSGTVSAPAPVKGTGQAALLFLAYATVSGVLLYAGCASLWSATGSLSLRSLGLLASIVALPIPPLVCLWLSGFIKVAACPTHLWLTKVHVEASTIGSTLLAGVGLKIGFIIHLLLWSTLRLGLVDTLAVTWIGLALGAIGITGAVLFQVDLKRWIASFSIVHVNLLYLLALMPGVYSSLQDGKQLTDSLHESTLILSRTGLGTGVTLGMIGHSFIAASLFIYVGTMADLRGSRATLELSGSLPATGRSTLLFLVLANGAFPGTSLFVSEVLCYLHCSSISFVASLFTISLSAVALVAGVHVWVRLSGRGQVSTATSERATLPLHLIVLPLTFNVILLGTGTWMPLGLIKESALGMPALGASL
eukprot:TRINITY_DN8241_c0_g1_i1.p1 TRINITY_DN8241_c0_g1~~TRINITY_DN8241_c0_g1_i1.p1  ORF type:complete len:511 (+),score=-61.00 TRINITY_DN8241_c0_g1_i1:49-1581(+)